MVAGAQCHTGVPIPCPCQVCRVGCPGSPLSVGAAQVVCPAGERGHGAEQGPAEDPAVLRPQAVGSHRSSSRTLIQLFFCLGFFFSFPKKKAIGFLGIKRHLLLTPECLNLMKYPGGGIKANSLGLVPQPQRNQAGAGGHDTLYSCHESERKKLALIN